MKNRIIPFGWLPAFWGLAGPARKIAHAHYYYEGYELDIALAEIHLTGEEFTRKKLEIDFQYGILTRYQYDVEVATLIPDDLERKITLLGLDIQYGSKDAVEGEKEIATLRGEPWVRVINDGLNIEDGPDGYYFEFDWNTLWIEMLRDAGFAGPSEEAIVQAWFQELCRQEAAASFGAPPINGGIR